MNTRTVRPGTTNRSTRGPGESLKASGRALLSRAGGRAAELDGRPATHRMLLRAVPQALSMRFQPQKADGLDTVLELRVRDPAGGEPARYTIRVKDNACTVTPGAAPNASAATEIGGDDMIRLVTGAVGWPELLAAQRLELSGDVFVALRFPQLFNLPA